MMWFHGKIVLMECFSIMDSSGTDQRAADEASMELHHHLKVHQRGADAGAWASEPPFTFFLVNFIGVAGLRCGSGAQFEGTEVSCERRL